MSAPSNNNTNQSLSACEVGYCFVNEYYKHFSGNPEILHKFYEERSTLVRGLEGEEVKTCTGIEAIRKSIADMHLKDANVDISNIDSLDSSENKVIIQVIGRFTNNGQTRRFVQTVSLASIATQRNGYYVHSDIFRYLKDEINDITKPHPIDRESTYNGDVTSSITEEKSNEDSVSTMSTGILAEEPTQEIVPETQPGTSVSQSSTKSTIEGTTIPTVEEAAPDIETKEPVPIDRGTTPITVQTEKNSTVSNTMAQLTSPTQSPSKVSYSNVAASDSNKWGQHIPEQKGGRVVQPPGLTRTQSQSSNRDQRVKGLSLYVGGVTSQQMTHENLTEALGVFGHVKSLDIVYAKSCAFVEFSSHDAYQKALQAKYIQVPGLSSQVTVEERQEKHRPNDRRYRQNNYDYQHQRNFNHSSQNHHNGMGGQRGSRGGDRRNTVPRPPAKSPS